MWEWILSFGIVMGRAILLILGFLIFCLCLGFFVIGDNFDMDPKWATRLRLLFWGLVFGVLVVLATINVHSTHYGK